MKYEIKQLNDTDAVVIGTGREEIKENTNTFKEGFNGDWFWCAKYNKIANNGDITAFDFKVIATIAPFKIEGLPMLELPNPAYDWFASKTYLEQHSLSDKYFESRNPSLLTNEQVTEMYKLELPNQEEDVEKLAMDYLDRTYSLSYERTTWQKLHEKTFIAGYKAAQKQYSEADMRDTCYRMWYQSDMFHNSENFEDWYKEHIQSLQKKQFPTSVELTEDLQIIKWHYE